MLEKKCSNNREKLGLQPKCVFTYDSNSESLKQFLKRNRYFFDLLLEASKGKIKPKADWRAIDSPKKQTNKFVLFAEKSKKANKMNFVCLFVFWENLWRANLLSVLSDL